MVHPNEDEKTKNNKNNTVVITSKAAATTTILILGIIVIVSGVTAPLTALGSLSGEEGSALTTFDRRVAAVLASEDEIYVAWSSYNTENGNAEVMFRASNDSGATFRDMINLSNTTDANSWGVEIHGEGRDVIVTWWETNQISDTPVARISADGGQIFGPMINLAAANSTSSGIIIEEATTAAEEPVEEEPVEEEPVEEEPVEEEPVEEEPVEEEPVEEEPVEEEPVEEEPVEE